MQMPITGHERFHFLEGTRGAAALMVVFLHFCSAFFPVFARVELSETEKAAGVASYVPWFFLVQGGLWISIFFLMSGFVLTQSFLSTQYSFTRQVYKRTTRLFIPIAASVFISVALVLLVPPAKEYVFNASHSTWITQLFLSPLDFRSIAKDLFLSSMLIGYQIGSIFNTLSLVPVSPLAYSMNAPMWTLHAELWGSLLVLVTTWSYARLRRALFWILFVAVFIMTIWSFCTLFLLGFLAYLSHHAILSKRGSWVGAAMVVLGLIIDTMVSSPSYRDSLAHLTSLQNPNMTTTTVASILMLLGIAVSPSIKAGLESKPMMFLGKISFSLYLVHFPILFTLGFAMFRSLSKHLTYVPAVIGTSFVTAVVSILAATCFERFIDRNAVRISKRWVSFRPARPADIIELNIYDANNEDEKVPF